MFADKKSIGIFNSKVVLNRRRLKLRSTQGEKERERGRERESEREREREREKERERERERESFYKWYYLLHHQDLLLFIPRSVQVRRFSGLSFTVFGLNTENHHVNLSIHSKYGKTQTRKNSVFRFFSCICCEGQYGYSPFHWLDKFLLKFKISLLEYCMAFLHYKSCKSSFTQSFHKAFS